MAKFTLVRRGHKISYLASIVHWEGRRKEIRQRWYGGVSVERRILVVLSNTLGVTLQQFRLCGWS